MSALEPTGPNADQIAYWGQGAAPAWVGLQELLDEQMRPLGLAAIETLAPKPGEVIVDVGCGCGDTTLELARRVAPGGAVIGVDISGPMLEVAERRAAGAARFILGDAQTYTLPAADGVFSRFGVMFFADPAAAFANVRLALNPGGRVVFVCWRALTENEWMVAPAEAAAPLLPPFEGEMMTDAPGPFALANPDRLRRILREAGFDKIEIAPHDAKIGSSTVERAMRIAMNVGPLGRTLREHPDRRDAVTEVVRNVLEARADADGVQMDSATWIVSAR